MARSTTNESARADRVRMVYQYERFRLNQEFRHPTIGYASPDCWPPDVWRKLVRFCAKRSIDPAAYVQWALFLRGDWHNSIWEPNQLLQPAHMDAYTVDQPVIRLRVRQNKGIEIKRFRAEVAYEQAGGEPMGEALTIALLSDELEVSPLFRCAVAREIRSQQFDEIAKYFEDRALIQYQYLADLYDREWGIPWVQPWFRAAGAKLYNEAIYQNAFDEGARANHA
jgi:hypothetical protein